MIDVRGDVLRPPHGTKPAAVSEPYFREVWNYNNANFEELNDKIRQYNWDHVINDTFFVDEACNNFTEAYINLCKVKR